MQVLKIVKTLHKLYKISNFTRCLFPKMTFRQKNGLPLHTQKRACAIYILRYSIAQPKQHIFILS